ncbi:MAG: aldehyde dehydrogenase [Rikenellaceae bacterium]|nr:aldehyde dehydrogenase [Rikenellaceae bacterium]
MKSTIQIFTELGVRLAEFGSDERSRSVIARAVAENEWFSVEDIRYAIDAVRVQMLDADKIAKWLACYPAIGHRATKRVAVIMAGNIPLVGFFDLMCVIASGNIPCVKPSSKDHILEEYIEQLLLDIEPELRIERYAEDEEYDAVIATGGDSANLYFRTAFDGVPSLLRGSRHSVAVLSGKESKADLLHLADDIFRYSGLGCRNVSLVFVPKRYSLSLEVRKMCRAYHNNYLQCRALLTMQGVEFKDLGEAVLVPSKAEFPRFLSQINVVEYSSLNEVQAWLEESDDVLQCVVSNVDGLHSRCVPFGRAQLPTLFDYADERDIMQFLTSLD